MRENRTSGTVWGAPGNGRSYHRDKFMNDYYVYVYIDPRNLDEFYYGKGKGSRKYAHLSDESDSGKAKRIRAIKREGLVPIIRVIASDLSENEALLIESTLLWKLGKYTENVASGHFSGRFRPHNMLHSEISGFDYQKSIYYYNVGEGPHRNWDDYTKYGFISGGQGVRWRDAMLGFNPGDIVVAYLKRRGFVGIGRIREIAKPISKVIIKGKPLLTLKLKCPNMADNSDNLEKSEYVARVKWIAKVPRNEAKWKPKSSLFTTQLVRASLDNQPETMKFIEREFGIDLKKLVV